MSSNSPADDTIKCAITMRLEFESDSTQGMLDHTRVLFDALRQAGYKAAEGDVHVSLNGVPYKLRDGQSDSEEPIGQEEVTS